MKNVFFVSVLLIALLGCLESSAEEFNLGEAFTIHEGKKYISQEREISFEVVSVQQACGPEDNCIHNSEGITIKVIKGVEEKSIYLGLNTSPERDLFEHVFRLVSVNTENRSAELVVTENNTGNKKAWFVFSPEQCQSVAWREWALNNPEFANETSNNVLIENWLKIVYGVDVLDVRETQEPEPVCHACGCPTGIKHAVLVPNEDGRVMRSVGWEEMENIGCALDALVCPDGSAVGRIPPFCEFEKC